MQTIKDVIRQLSVKVIKNGKTAGAGTLVKANGYSYVVTAAHVPFGKEFEDIESVTPSDIAVEFEGGGTVDVSSFIGTSEMWTEHDVVAMGLGADVDCVTILPRFSNVVEKPDQEFLFRGVPVVTGNEFKFYEGFKFDDKSSVNQYQITLHGDMKYLTDFNGFGGAELNAGVSGSGVFLNEHSAPYIVGVITDVPYPNGAFGAFQATLIEPVRNLLGLDYENPSLTLSNKASRVSNYPVIYYEDETLKELLSEHEKEKEKDVDYREFSDDLNKYFGRCIRKKIRSLEEKLNDSDREYLLEYAMDAKEQVTKKIHSLAFYKSAQDVYTYLLTNIRTAFLHQIQSKIKSGNFKNYEIDDIVNKEIIYPYLQNLSGSSLRITESELYGILYFLTGNCYIEWD